MKVYEAFEEVEKEIEEATPPIIYKYRTWENDFHKKIITDNEVWFAHPHNLNDPYDIRVPYKFISDSIDWEAAKNKLKKTGKVVEPHLSDEELNSQVEKRLTQMKDDPTSYFQNSRKGYILDKSHYDSIGVFSCCSSFQNEAMWAHYGDNHCGFALGFNTVRLSQVLDCALGYVDYNDDPLEYYILGNNDSLIEKEIFRKSTKWSYEEELRFVTAGIEKTKSRACKYHLSAAAEIVFGLMTSKKVQTEIIEVAKDKLPNIPIYQVVTNSDRFGFSKTQIM